MDSLFHDIRFGFRTMLRNPGFAAIAILTLAIGIGANAALFSVIDGVLLKSLPIKDADRVMFVWETNPSISASTFATSTLNYRDWKEGNHSFSVIAGRRGFAANLVAGGEPERVIGERVTADYFTALGVDPIIGRSFQPGDDKLGAEPLVLLSRGLWQRRFGGDQNIIGQAITLNGQKCTVTGVMPNDYRPNIEFWTPLQINYDNADRYLHDTTVVARLAPGVSISQAQAEMNTILARMTQQYPEMLKGWGIQVVPMHDSIVQNIRLALLVLFGAVAFVLLIACTNVANLLLARAAVREREIAIRIALGAGRMRLIRQLLTESLLISVIGGGIGILIAIWGTNFLISLNPQGIPLSSTVGVDYRVLGFTFVVSVLAGLLFGIVPALQSTKLNLNETLKESKSSGNARAGLIRSALVVSEITLALVLLIGAGLLIKSFSRLQDVDPGFNYDRMLTFQISLPPTLYSKPNQITGFFKNAVDRISALPGVKGAGAISQAPLAANGPRYIFYAEGRPLPAPNEAPLAAYRIVTPTYFQAMGIPLIAGRFFTEADDDKAQPVIIVSQSLAKQMWPGQDPIGKGMTVGVPLPGQPINFSKIIGVVGDVKHTSLSGDPDMQMYDPLLQSPSPSMAIVMRSAVDPISLADSARKTIAGLDPALPIANMKTMDTVVYESMAPFRFNMSLLTIFAGVALLLTIIGIYGVMSYSVSQRTREIGIRIALGAKPSSVRTMIIKQGLILAAIGLVFGLTGSFFAKWILSSLLFGISATDPTIFVGVALIIVVISALACYIPARRATRIDPMIALRYE